MAEAVKGLLAMLIHIGYNDHMASPIIHFRVASRSLRGTLRAIATRERKTISQVVRELLIEGLEHRARRTVEQVAHGQ